MHACMHACMYVCMYLCMYVAVYPLNLVSVQQTDSINNC